MPSAAQITDGTVETLVGYATSVKYEDLPGEVIAQVKRLTLDALACGLAATAGTLTAKLTAAAPVVAEGPRATLLGSGRTTTPEMAALVNGALMRYHDMMDTYIGNDICHIEDNVCTLLAAGEAEHASGRDFIVASVVAYEILAAACDTYALQTVGPFDQSIFHSISGPLAAGLLMRLERDELAEALRLSLVSNLALLETRKGSLSMWKACQVPNAGRNAIHAARLARCGLTGPPRAFEGECGFIAATKPKSSEMLEIGGRGGASYRMLRSSIKAYPANYLAQAGIAASLKCREALAYRDIADVKEVTVKIFSRALKELSPEKWKPETRETADHSTPYAIGVALAHGELSPRHYDDEFLFNDDLIALVGKIHFEVDPAADALYPTAVRTTVTIELHDGRKSTTTIDHPPGHFMNPMPARDFRERLRSMLSATMTFDRGSRLFEMIEHLEELQDVGEVSAFYRT